MALCLDADAAGQQQWRQLARQAALWGKVGVEDTLLKMATAYGPPRWTGSSR